MSTTAEKLSLLLSTKDDIKAALLEKGQTASDVFSTYADKIRAIDTLSSGTADATAEAGEIFAGESAYVKGQKVTGTFTLQNEMNSQNSLIEQIQYALTNKSATGIVVSDDGAGNVTVTMRGVTTTYSDGDLYIE